MIKETGHQKQFILKLQWCLSLYDFRLVGRVIKAKQSGNKTSKSLKNIHIQHYLHCISGCKATNLSCKVFNIYRALVLLGEKIIKCTGRKKEKITIRGIRNVISYQPVIFLYRFMWKAALWVKDCMPDLQYPLYRNPLKLCPHTVAEENKQSGVFNQHIGLLRNNL